MNTYSSLPIKMAMFLLQREHGLSEVEYWQVYSAFARQDWECVKKYLTWWGKRQSVHVSRFTPGEHYHVLGVKFDTLAEAQQHLEREGYNYAGLREVHVYRPE